MTDPPINAAYIQDTEARLRRELELLRKDHERLSLQREGLLCRVAELRAENNTLKDAYLRRCAEYDTLKDSYSRLEAENKLVSDERDAFHKWVEAQRAEIDKLRAEIELVSK